MSPIRKFIGIVLLASGLVIIFYSLYSSYNIFTAKTSAPEIFRVEADTPPQGGGVEEIISEQLKGMIPADSIPQLLNLIAWSIFAGILIFAGAQIAGLGVKLIS
ncbi:MAG: hypothetical protein COT59_00765 [Candidatus Nealsonbacteria bacterium CG09_land_8_20_14_0_10_42_14]|uniref:Uncharacterized protein n=1 Tax=Candidatus Nealsonbacteria bacterium CG09_land_8_20_14_0_10_42_14 TaxID=1974707 RepID=A0A2H0WXL9_9BACT|nr:MAG: hypothetical protein COT59_00765 [Candidatus Nealsonbacteria bacterium CG09_land_8_20_14_0_10_42_14]